MLHGTKWCKKVQNGATKMVQVVLMEYGEVAEARKTDGANGGKVVVQWCNELLGCIRRS